jgi:uncharacterized protein YjiS (DUF1127 family)
MRLLATIATTLAQYHQFNAYLRRLNTYSDRQLDDMGVMRGDLTRLAWEEAERCFPVPAETGAGGYGRTTARSIELAVAGQR